MSRRPTVADIAREAGVGVATVDRVLNGRAAVRAETGHRVLEAARSIGYHGTALLKRRLDEAAPQYRLGFLLQRPEHPFYQAFRAALLDACSGATYARLQPEIMFLPSQNPADIAVALHSLARRVQAIAMVAIDHPSVSAAVAELEAAGTPVFSMLSDFAAGVRHGYIGTNNRTVGRTSAWLLARSVKAAGEVAIFVGSHRFHGHEMREIGCRSYLREAAPDLEVVETQASLEDGTLAHEAVLDLLGRRPNLKGLYVAGGGVEGVIAALRAEVAPGQIAVVAPELTEVTRPALADNYVSAVVATPLPALSQQIAAQMAASLTPGEALPPGQTFLPFEIYVSENI
jgi:LacI family transcriptional regulator